MIRESQEWYQYEGSLVSGRDLWSISHEEVLAQGTLLLPRMREEVHHWVVLRPSISSIQLLTLHGQSNEPPQDSIHDTERSFIGAARREAGEFTRAALFRSSSVTDIQGELGDITFFLLIPYINYDLKESAVEWLSTNHFDTVKDEQLRAEFTNQPGEKVVESAVGHLDDTLGHGSLGMVSKYEDFGRALATTYAVIFRYALAAGWDLGEILHKTRLKNDHNYPDLLFAAGHSPFPYFQDAIDCLRLFRSAVNPSGKNYLTVLYERFGEPISWIGHNIEAKEFKVYVVSLLEEIEENAPLEDHKSMAKILLWDSFSRDVHKRIVTT